MKTIGERIAFLRESANMSQRKLMDILNFSNLGRFEKNERIPGIDIIISISDYFGVSTDWILKGEDSNVDVNRHHNDNEHGLLIKRFDKLTVEEKRKIEGIIEGFLLAREMHSDKRKTSSNSTHGEEAATSETA